MESTSDYPLAWTVSRNVRTFLDDMAPASVGKRLKRLREGRDLTQDQLADLIGVKERTVSRWETGASRGLYDDDVLDKLAAALHVAAEDIIGPRAVPPAELHDIKAQLDRIETALTEIRDDQRKLTADLRVVLLEELERGRAAMELPTPSRAPASAAPPPSSSRAKRRRATG